MDSQVKHQLDDFLQFITSSTAQELDDEDIRSYMSFMGKYDRETAFDVVDYVNTKTEIQENLGFDVIQFFSPDFRTDKDFLSQMIERGAETQTIFYALSDVEVPLEIGKWLIDTVPAETLSSYYFGNLPDSLLSNADFLAYARENGVSEYRLRDHSHIDEMSIPDKVRSYQLLFSKTTDDGIATYDSYGFGQKVDPEADEVVPLIKAFLELGDEGRKVIDSIDWVNATSKEALEAVDLLGADKSFTFLKTLRNEEFGSADFLKALKDKGVSLQNLAGRSSFDGKTIQEKIDAIDYIPAESYGKMFTPKSEEVLPLVQGLAAKGENATSYVGSLNWSNATEKDVLSVVDFLGADKSIPFLNKVNPELLGMTNFLGSLLKKGVSDEWAAQNFPANVSYQEYEGIMKLLGDEWVGCIRDRAKLSSDQILWGAEHDPSFVNNAPYNLKQLTVDDSLKMISVLGHEDFTHFAISNRAINALGDFDVYQKLDNLLQTKGDRYNERNALFSQFIEHSDAKSFLAFAEINPAKAIEIYNDTRLSYVSKKTNLEIFKKIYEISEEENKANIITLFVPPYDFTLENAGELLETCKEHATSAYHKLPDRLKIEPKIVSNALSLVTNPEQKDDIIATLRIGVNQTENLTISQARSLKEIDPGLFNENAKMISEHNYQKGSYLYVRFNGDSEKTINTATEYSNKHQLFSWHELEPNMALPPEYIMNAIGTRHEHIKAFYNSQQEKGSVLNFLTQTPLYKNAPNEAKTDIIKLFAHMGCLEPFNPNLKQSQNEENRKQALEIIDKVSQKLTGEEIHSMFGGLPQGFSLPLILQTQDKNQEVDSSQRDRYDPKGKKAAQFVLDNLEHPDARIIASHALTNYVRESVELGRQLLDAQKALQVGAKEANNHDIRQTAIEIETITSEMMPLVVKKENGSLEKKERRELSSFEERKSACRKKLIELMRESGDKHLGSLADNVDKYNHKLCAEDIAESLSKVAFPNAQNKRIAAAAIAAGYVKTYEDTKAVDVLCEIFEAAQNAPEKYFSKGVFDKQQSGITYFWAEVDNPQLYSIATAVDRTCMRPFHQNEAALWEAATSKDVKVAFILDEYRKPIAYLRTNYDVQNEGIYIDIVDSHKAFVTNNEQVWQTAKRAWEDMATKMNEDGQPVRIVNYRYDDFNKLKTQFGALPETRMPLRGRAYHDERATTYKTYGENKNRDQREVWVNPKFFGGSQR